MGSKLGSSAGIDTAVVRGAYGGLETGEGGALGGGYGGEGFLHEVTCLWVLVIIPGCVSQYARGIKKSKTEENGWFGNELGEGA